MPAERSPYLILIMNVVAKVTIALYYYIQQIWFHKSLLCFTSNACTKVQIRIMTINLF